MIRDKNLDGQTYWWDADYNPDSGQLTYKETHYIGDVLEENKRLQADPKNGWTDDRTMRRIGQIPAALLMDPDFRALGRDERHVFLRWFLDRHPECRTVDKILHVGANDGYVIVK